MNRVERLRQLVLRLSNAERVGGRAEMPDQRTVILYDCMHWGSYNTDVVLSHHPEIQISVKASRQSLSGFTVTFFVPHTLKQEVFWYCVIGIALACCTLAQATNTRLDSACKHIQQCRVSTDDMMRFAHGDAEEVQRNKYRYCIHKDELVVGVGRPWDTSAVMKRTSNSAYPKVISNLGALSDREDSKIAITMIRFMNHYARSVRERELIINFFQKNQHVDAQYTDDATRAVRRLPEVYQAFKAKPGGIMGTKNWMDVMTDHFAVGFANTVGFAHPNTGDTMTSVMIGGLRTVMNGDFEIFPGDLVQFYWCFEKDDFLPSGRRKPYLDIWQGEVPCNVNPSVTVDPAVRTSSHKRNAEGDEVWGLPEDARIRQAHYNLSYGQKADKMKLVAKIKPYFRDDQNPRLMDWFRVFGIAIASARPNEMCDIKISRQSM